MIDNPFSGTPLEEPWHDGFVAGFVAADLTISPPSPLTLEAQDAYAKGMGVGQALILGLAVPPTTPPPEPGEWTEIGVLAAEGVLHLFVDLSKPTLVWSKFGLGLSLSLFVSVAVFGPDRSQPFFEEGAAQAVRRVRDALANAGLVANNLDLFMAACDLQNHDVAPQTDELTRQGYFHGRVFLNVDDAMSEARAHGHPDNTVVLHFQTSTPEIVEIIPLPSPV